MARLPSVDRLLKADAIAPLIDTFGRVETTAAIRNTLAGIRKDMAASGDEPPTDTAILEAGLRRDQ